MLVELMLIVWVADVVDDDVVMAVVGFVVVGIGMLVSLRSLSVMYFILPDTWRPFGTSW